MGSAGSVGSGVSDGFAESEGPLGSVGSLGYVRFMRSEGSVRSVGLWSLRGLGGGVGSVGAVFFTKGRIRRCRKSFFWQMRSNVVLFEATFSLNNLTHHRNQNNQN